MINDHRVSKSVVPDLAQQVIQLHSHSYLGGNIRLGQNYRWKVNCDPVIKAGTFVDLIFQQAAHSCDISKEPFKISRSAINLSVSGRVHSDRQVF
jgi:hypothetical protein